MPQSQPPLKQVFAKQSLLQYWANVNAACRIIAVRAQKEPLRAVVLYVLFVSLVFLTFPEIDTFFAGLFYSPQEGFTGNDSQIVHAVRASGRYLQIGIVIIFLFPLFAKVAAPGSPIIIAPRTTLFVTGALVIGPGLLVNGILKEVWGRARPRDLDLFGENKVFSPAWVMSDQCESNCSFVSGEAASAIWLVVLVFLAPRAWRTVVLTATLCAAFLISTTRVLMGAHFLSDVLLAWGLVLIIILVWYRIVMVSLPSTFDSSIEQTLAGVGRRIRRLQS